MLDGRGRYYRFNTRSTVDDLLRLDMAKFAHSVDLSAPTVGAWQWVFSRGRTSSITYSVILNHGVRLMYNNGSGNQKEAVDYLVNVTSTPCNLGGKRYWWICPNVHCGRRCRVLYGGKYFVCWKCAGAYYASQRNKDLLTRIDNELATIRRRLKASKPSATTTALPDRPKGMHFRTYMRLSKRYNDLQYYRVLSIGIDIAKMGEAMGIRTAGSAEDMAYQLKWLMDNE